MPVYHRLHEDLQTNRWSLRETLELERALGVPVDRATEESSLDAVLAETKSPEAIEEPLQLTVGGGSRSSLLLRGRGFGKDGTCDLIVAPELDRVLADFTLPAHARIRCVTRVRRKPHDFTWLWWRAGFEHRIDPSRSLFRLAGRSRIIRRLVG